MMMLPRRSNERRRRRSLHNHNRAHFREQSLLPPLCSSSASLIKSLIDLSRSVASLEKESAARIVCQRRNISIITRRVRTLLIFLEDLITSPHFLSSPSSSSSSSTPEPLPPSALLSFGELHVVLQGIKLMLEDCVECSRMWLLVENRKLSETFHLLTQEMATALDVLPLPLLNVSGEVREQVELICRQARKAKVHIDPKETELLAHVQYLMKQIERGEMPEVEKLVRVFLGLKLNSGMDCQQEIERLEEEAKESSMLDDAPPGSDGRQAIMKIPVYDLVGLVRYGKCVLYGATEIAEDIETGESAQLEGEEEEEEEDDDEEEELFISARVPEDFRCPISFDVMTDPVIVATGQTYDRCSITKWMLEQKNQTCPKSGLKLEHSALIPNHALRNLILQWSSSNNFNLRIPSRCYTASASSQGRGGAWNHPTPTALEATKLTVELLLRQLPSADPVTRRNIAGEIRFLTKCGSANRKVVAEAGAIPALLNLLRRSTTAIDIPTQAHAVTAILNLSIYPPNKARIVDSGGIDPLVDILKSTSSSSSSSSDIARENAAATVFSLSQITEYAAMLGEKKGLMEGLMKLLGEGSSQRGRRDATCAIFNMAVYGPNRGKLVKAGVVQALFERLQKRGRVGHLEEEVLAVIAVISHSSEGREAICAINASVPILIDLLRTGNQKTKENVAAVILQLCRHGGHDMVAKISGSARAFQNLLSHGTPRARRKASSLLRLIFRAESQQINHRITTTAHASSTQDTATYSTMMLSYTTAAH